MLPRLSQRGSGAETIHIHMGLKLLLFVILPMHCTNRKRCRSCVWGPPVSIVGQSPQLLIAGVENFPDSSHHQELPAWRI